MPEDAMMERVGKNIRSIRHEKGWTLKVLAEKVGCSTGSLFKYENNITVMAVTKLCEIAKVLEVPVDHLMTAQLPECRRRRQRS